MNSKIRFAFKCLYENKVRFFLTIISITVGVTSVLTVNAISSFGVTQVSSELDSLGMNGLVVAAESGNAVLTTADAELLSDVNGVDEVAAVTINTAKVRSKDNKETKGMVWGIDEKAGNVVSFELLYGRLIDKSDMKSCRRVCILDETLSLNLFGQENAVGKTIELMQGSGTENFEVIGIVKTGKGIMQSLMGNFFPAFLYTPYTSLDNSPDFNQFFIKTSPAYTSAEIAESLKLKLENTKAGEEIAVTDLAGQKTALENMLSTVTMVLTVIGAVSLLVSGISIMNIMLISVNERTNEIGIKKSIGASRKDIMFDFLTESVIISLVGSLTGILASQLLCMLISYISGYALMLRFIVIVYTVTISAGFGIAFCIIPAYKASFYNPVEALRR